MLLDQTARQPRGVWYLLPPFSCLERPPPTAHCPLPTVPWSSDEDRLLNGIGQAEEVRFLLQISVVPTAQKRTVELLCASQALAAWRPGIG
jgi:hypothetical protein